MRLLNPATTSGESYFSENVAGFGSKLWMAELRRERGGHRGGTSLRNHWAVFALRTNWGNFVSERGLRLRQVHIAENGPDPCAIMWPRSGAYPSVPMG